MNAAQLDALIKAQQPDGSHGSRNCPYCGKGFMQYMPIMSSHGYQCQKCTWVEFDEPPWPRRGTSVSCMIGLSPAVVAFMYACLTASIRRGWQVMLGAVDAVRTGFGYRRHP